MLDDIIEAAKRYHALGTAVQEQLDKVIEDSSEETLCDLNINALAMIHGFLEFLIDSYAVDDEDVRLIAADILRYVEGYDGDPKTGQTIQYGRVTQVR